MDWLNLSTRWFLEDVDSDLKQMNVLLSVIFALCFLLLLFAYLALRPLEISIKEEVIDFVDCVSYV